MICALDCNRVANAKQEELKRIWEEEQKQLEKERKEKEMRLIKDSIDYCENKIATMIQDASKKGKYSIVLDFVPKSIYSDDICVHGLLEGYHYKNGKIAMYPNYNCPSLDLKIVCDYLESLCYTISKEQKKYVYDSRKYASYFEVRISWRNPTCLNKAN